MAADPLASGLVLATTMTRFDIQPLVMYVLEPEWRSGGEERREGMRKYNGARGGGGSRASLGWNVHGERGGARRRFERAPWSQSRCSGKAARPQTSNGACERMLKWDVRQRPHPRMARRDEQPLTLAGDGLSGVKQAAVRRG